jgi:hypothetical protein
MDFAILHDMTANAARNAERMCSQEGGSATGLPFQNYAGYPFYVDEYNRLVRLALEKDPEVAKYFEGVDLGTHSSPSATPGPLWKSYAELAAVRLNLLASYLKGKLGYKEKEHEQIIDLINANLRKSIYEDPKHEREVQNALEIIFNARTLEFHREKDTVPYSTKRYIPDFTFNQISLAVEVKLCRDEDRERKMIDEINADILGYGGRYERIVFVVYDLGFIRDTDAFRSDIEKNQNVNVLVVKR